MQKYTKKISTMFVAVAILGAGLTMAGSVYDRAYQVITNIGATGIGTWTNTAQQSMLKLEGIWIERCSVGVNTVKVERIISSPFAATQLVQYVYTTSTSNGHTCVTEMTNAWFMSYGDKLKFTSTATNAVGHALIEYQVQQH